MVRECRVATARRFSGAKKTRRVRGARRILSLVLERLRGGSVGLFHGGAQSLEPRVPVQQLQAWIGEYLEEPRAALIVGGVQFRHGLFPFAKSGKTGRQKRPQNEALAAEPLQAFENLVGLLATAVQSQSVCVYRVPN